MFGVDLSRQMVVTAQSEYPELQFLVGSFNTLELEIILFEGSRRGTRSFTLHPKSYQQGLSSRGSRRRRIRNHGLQVGNERRRIEEGYGYSISLDAYRLDPSTVTDQLESAGLLVQTRLVRQPDHSEKTPQACLLAQKARISDASFVQYAGTVTAPENLGLRTRSGHPRRGAWDSTGIRLVT